MIIKMVNDIDVAAKVINMNGMPAQLRKAAEELIELAKECMQVADGDTAKFHKLGEEVADVRFVMVQLHLMMDTLLDGKFSPIVDAAYEYKVKRTEYLIDRNIEKLKAKGDENAENNPNPTN
jgi:NTP pyrophosphatase (non-canonical NTP hydrolase)